MVSTRFADRFVKRQPISLTCGWTSLTSTSSRGSTFRPYKCTRTASASSSVTPTSKSFNTWRGLTSEQANCAKPNWRYWKPCTWLLTTRCCCSTWRWFSNDTPLIFSKTKSRIWIRWRRLSTIWTSPINSSNGCQLMATACAMTWQSLLLKQDIVEISYHR